MYYKKRVICCDKSGKIVATLTLSGNEGEVGVKISCYEDIDEVFLVGKDIEKTYKVPILNATFPYNGGKVGCVLLKKGQVVAVSKGELEPNILMHALEKCNCKRETSPKPKEVKKIVEEPPKEVEKPTVKLQEEKEEEVKCDIDENLAEPSPKKREVTQKEEREVAHFYCSIKKNLDETFTCYPNVKILEDTIPYSTWVEIKKDDTPYVVGLIREGDNPKYVCYGVLSDTSHKPPDDIAQYCQWLPTEEYKGYWIIFQDADTGETLKNE